MLFSLSRMTWMTSAWQTVTKCVYKIHSLLTTRCLCKHLKSSLHKENLFTKNWPCWYCSRFFCFMLWPSKSLVRKTAVDQHKILDVYGKTIWTWKSNLYSLTVFCIPSQFFFPKQNSLLPNLKKKREGLIFFPAWQQSKLWDGRNCPSSSVQTQSVSFSQI